MLYLPEWVGYLLEGMILGLGLLVVITLFSFLSFKMVNYTYIRMGISDSFMKYIKHRKKFHQWLKDPDTDKRKESKGTPVTNGTLDEVLSDTHENSKLFIYNSNDTKPMKSLIYLKDTLDNGDIVVGERLKIDKKEK